MDSTEHRSRSVAGPLVFFALTAVIAAGMLLTALLLWLAEIVGSVALACIMVGGLFALVALILYFASVRRTAARFREHLDTVYEVSRLAKSGYEWILRRICALFDD